MLRRAVVTVIALVLGYVMLPAAAASAGGWAVTVIDPVGTIEAGKAQRVSFWVLQHGTHPYNWSEPASIGRVGLTLIDDRGSQILFVGEALPEPAHFATTVTVPAAGKWKVVGVQGVFAGYHVGSLTVPGGFEPMGVPAAPSTQDMQKYWPGAVRPPVLSVDRNREPFISEMADPAVVAQPAAANTPPAPPAAAPAPAERDQRVPILAGGLALLLLAGFALAARRWWVRRGVASVSR